MRRWIGEAGGGGHFAGMHRSLPGFARLPVAYLVACVMGVLLGGTAAARLNGPGEKGVSKVAPAVARAAAQGFVRSPFSLLHRDPWGRIQIRVRLARLDAFVLEALRTVGMEVEVASKRLGVARGWIAPNAAARLAALENVRWVGLPDYAVTQSGSVTGEHDRMLGCDAVRALGADGSGVRIGVISDGIDSIATSQETGDAPAVTVPADPRCHLGSGDEGSAMIELVHDCAPGADVAFCGPLDDVEMIDCIQCLAEAFGADIIVDDLGFLLQPYFADGPIADAVENVVGVGVAYFTAAGNFASYHYQGTYRACADGSKRHDFGGGDCALDFTVVGPSAVILQWDDAFGASANDYDVCVRGCARDDDCSETIQNGDDDPVEVALCDCPEGETCEGTVEISRFTGRDAEVEFLFLPLARGAKVEAFEHGVAGDSIFGHQCASSAIAVGAIDAADPGTDTVEPFSSHGPCTIRFPFPEQRPKPDLTGIDGVANTRPGGFPSPFFGTSAAAPGVAAVAALLIDLNPALTVEGLRTAMEEGAVDVGAPGFDSLSGAGRVDALASSRLLGEFATPTPVHTPGPTPTPGPCFGDCDGDGKVSVNELVTGVNISSGRTSIGACPEFDSDLNGVLTVNELVQAVGAALHSCVGAPGV